MPFNLIDLLIVVVAGLTAYFGLRKGTIKQTGGQAGVIAGILLAAFLYNQLAFLTEDSLLKTLILAAIVVAATFLLYDLFSSLGSYAQKQPVFNRFRKSITDKIGSVSVTVVGSLLSLWLVFVIFNSLLPSSIKTLVKESSILSLTSRYLQPPSFISSASQKLQPLSAPEVFVGTEPDVEDMGTTVVTQQYDALDTAIAAATPSAIKVTTWGCGAIGSGSGFIVGKNLIATNAHVIAGVDRMSIQSQGTTYSARAVVFDPMLDIAILRTENDIAGPVLSVEPSNMPSGSIGAALGYPNGGNLTIDDVVIIRRLSAEGYDIYQKQKVVRQIYAVRGSIVPGDSGAPLITSKGLVAGVIIGHSSSNARIGYAVVSSQIQDHIKAAHGRNDAVDIGPCAGA